MTIAELEIQGEFVNTQLTEKQAKALDKKVRAASAKVVTGAEALRNYSGVLLDLIEQAARGDIHKGLETTWTAWFKDAVRITPANREDRKHLVQLMSGKSLSQRALAGVFNVDQTTIGEDLREAGEGNPSPVTTGLDGKTYTRPVDDEPVDEPIDAEFEEEEYEEGSEEPEVETPPTPAAELVTDFDDEFTIFWNALAQMYDIVHVEPKWPQAKKRVFKAHLNDLQEAKGTLETILDALMAD